MSWTHFTALLAEGDFITEAQRNELYDAFLERAEAVGPWLSITYAASSDLRTGGFATDLIERSGGNPAVRLISALSTIAAHYWRPETIDDAITLDAADNGGFLVFDPTDPTSLWYLACAEAGVTAAEFTDLYNEPEIDAWKRWNVIREAIRLLKYPRVKTVGSVAVYNMQLSYATWADLKTAFFAYPETGGYSPGASSPLWLRSYYSAGPYDIEASRGVWTLDLPAVDAFSDGYTLYGLLSRGVNDNQNLGVTVNFNGSPTSVGSLPVETDRQAYAISGGGNTITGNQDVEAGMAGYFNSGDLDPYETDPVDTEKDGEAYLLAFAAAPTFSFV